MYHDAKKGMAATGLEHLTENDIDEILSRLPTKDAVRTSVLSRSWRHRWKSIPDLDLSFVPLAAADKTLLLHSAPVRHFKFQIGNLGSELAPSSTLEPLFEAIARRSSSSLRSIDIFSRCVFPLSTVAHCFPRLTLIKLSACVIKRPHRTTIFPHLRTLDVADVTLDDDDRVRKVSVLVYFPACPKLEKLSLELNHCIHRRDIDTIGRDFPSLTHLDLRGCHLNFVPSALATTVFPDLRTLYITNFSLDLDDVDTDITGHLSFTMYIPACPKLEKLILDSGYRKNIIPCDMDTIGLDFPRLSHLQLGSCHLNIVPSSLASLRVLHLYKVSVDGELSVLFSSFPSLETLILRDVNLVAEKHLHVSAPNLRLLELAQVRHGWNVLRDFSIANSPALETVLFDLYVECYFKCGSDEEENFECGGDEEEDFECGSDEEDDFECGGDEEDDFKCGGDEEDKFECGSDEEDDEMCNLMKVLGGLPRVKKLTLLGRTIEFLRGGLVLEKLPTSFEHLTNLWMDVDFSDIRDTSVLCLLLKSAPTLQEVHLKCRGKYFSDRGDFWKERQHMDAFDNLKTVRMTLLGDEEVVFKFELEVIQFVLSKARVLETMMIEFMYDNVCEESFMKKVLEFPKASHQAQFVFPIARS